ncbi:MAG: leucine-rich repeat domain-containing protein, partial [Oscillospiraceae bacterium]|nr:leucine-rich repeat domain-containing protein [Oscillospiraceae bacterium]
ETPPPAAGEAAPGTDAGAGGENRGGEGGFTEAELLALPEEPADSYSYDEADGGIRILGSKGGLEIAVIPSKIDGKDVLQIGAGAFRYNADLKAVVLPESVTKIGKEAFAGCLELESVAFREEGLKEIGEKAFEACLKLSEFNLPNSVTGIGLCAFLGCAALKQIDFPDNITIIEAGTFGMTGLEMVKLNDVVVEIGSGAFGNCVKLQSCEVPNTVLNIVEDAFANSPNVVIVASPDSYAAQYAAERGISFQAA